ncbi:MAG: cell division protein ZapA [Deltaproteobacteria bacterium]|jgi:cell division protein ZapA (FtsZ GTPase activity inhibitor)|nr:cell division protein ZapA [Deltaproteobacteria bacterium]
MTASDDLNPPEGRPPASFGEDPAPPGGEKFHSPEVDASGLVTITLFGRKYHVRSDKPDLIFQLAYIVQSAINEVGDGGGDSELAALDTLVQASFRLALQLNNARGEEKILRENIESLEKRIQELLDLIDRSAGGL